MSGGLSPFEQQVQEVQRVQAELDAANALLDEIESVPVEQKFRYITRISAILSKRVKP